MTRTCASQSGPAPIPMVGIARSWVTCAARSRGMPSRTSAKAPASWSAAGVVEEALAIGGAPGLHLHATELVDRLRRQAEVAHHRDAPLGEARDRLDDPATALELDRVHAGLEVLGRVDDRVLAGPLVRPEREVPDEELLRRAAGDRPGVMEHLGHRHRDGVRVAEHVVGEGVADEQHRHLGLGEQPRGRVVVRGEHDELRPGRLSTPRDRGR